MVQRWLPASCPRQPFRKSPASSLLPPAPPRHPPSFRPRLVGLPALSIPPPTRGAMPWREAAAVKMVTPREAQRRRHMRAQPQALSTSPLTSPSPMVVSRGEQRASAHFHRAMSAQRMGKIHALRPTFDSDSMPRAATLIGQPRPRRETKRRSPAVVQEDCSFPDMMPCSRASQVLQRPVPRRGCHARKEILPAPGACCI